MALGPAPCRTMCRNPRAFGFSGASLAASPEPEESALIASYPWFVPLASTAAARAAAILALVAGPVRHHEHAALGARRRALVRVPRLGRSDSRLQTCHHGVSHCRQRLNGSHWRSVFAVV